MQVNNVGYNNYGYANQKAQKNKNQQSFGMAQGGTLIRGLEEKATYLQTNLTVNGRAALGKSLRAIDRYPTPVELIGDDLYLRDGNKARVVGTGNIIDQAALAVKKLEELGQLKREASCFENDQALVPQLEAELERFDKEAIQKLRKGELTLEADIAASDLQRAEKVEAIRVARTKLESSTKAKTEIDKFFPGVFNADEMKRIEDAEREMGTAKLVDEQVPPQTIEA